MLSQHEQAIYRKKATLFIMLSATDAFIDNEKLREYLDYCYDNAKRYSSNSLQVHHIVPKSLSKVWGLEKLMRKNYTHVNMTDTCHKHAHWLLYENLKKEYRKVLNYHGIKDKRKLI